MKSFAFLLFLITTVCACCNSADQETNLTVELLSFKGFDTALVSNLKNTLQTVFKCQISITQAIEKPAEAFYPSRQRYRADSLLLYLSRLKRVKSQYIVGLLEDDISISLNGKKDWGVFGFAYCPGRSAVISTYRLNRNRVSTSCFQNRLQRVVLHELGHNLGLTHCQNKSCLMQDAKGKITTLDIPNSRYCNSCSQKINNHLN